MVRVFNLENRGGECIFLLVNKYNKKQGAQHRALGNTKLNNTNIRFAIVETDILFSIFEVVPEPIQGTPTDTVVL